MGKREGEWRNSDMTNTDLIFSKGDKLNLDDLYKLYGHHHVGCSVLNCR